MPYVASMGKTAVLASGVILVRVAGSLLGGHMADRFGKLEAVVCSGLMSFIGESVGSVLIIVSPVVFGAILARDNPGVPPVDAADRRSAFLAIGLGWGYSLLMLVLNNLSNILFHVGFAPICHLSPHASQRLLLSAGLSAPW